LNLKTYRIPSVLGTIGISSLVCTLESYLIIKPPILPAILGLSWYMVSLLRPFHPLHLSAQAWLDQRIFGPSHLYEPAPGFDPEGILAALLTVPISSLLGSYLARPIQNLATIETPQLIGLGILGSLLTGLLPSPASKLLWTTTYVGQTTATSLLYWAISRALVSLPNRLTLIMSSALEMLGQRSLEIYLISASVPLALTRIGTWDRISHLMNNLLTLIGFKDDHNRDILVGIARSSLLGISMIPFAKLLIHLGWKV
jgi:predicted acyltransferase